MSSYFETVSSELKEDWKNPILVIIFTVGRLIYGWAWFSAGWEKLSWLSGGKFYAGSLIHTLINNLAGPKVTRFDPLDLDRLFAWLAQNIFLPMGRLTDILVVLLELVIGIMIIVGFRIFWVALIATFLNLQYFAAGSYNNFGYIWTNLALLKFAKYADLIGVDGFLRHRKKN